MNGYNTPVRDGWEIYISILFSSFIGQSLFIYLRVSIFFLNRGFSFNFYFCAVCDRATASVPKRLFYFIFLIEWRNNNVPKEGRNLLYQSGTWFIDQIASKFLFFPFIRQKFERKKKQNFASAGCWGPYNPDQLLLRYRFYHWCSSSSLFHFISWEDMKGELFDYYTPFSTKKKEKLAISNIGGRK